MSSPAFETQKTAVTQANYLATGNLGPEKLIRKNVLHLARWLRKQNISVTVSEKNAGHSLDFWASELPNALEWFREITT